MREMVETVTDSDSTIGQLSIIGDEKDDEALLRMMGDLILMVMTSTAAD